MTIAKEELDLAGRHDADLAAVRAQTLKIRQLTEDELERVKEHNRLMKVEEAHRSSLHAKAKASGKAFRELLLSVPQPLRNAVDAAERAQRDHEPKHRTAKRAVKNIQDGLAKLREKKADKEAIEQMKASLAEAEVELRDMDAQAKTIEADLAAAKKAARAALEHEKKAAAGAPVLASLSKTLDGPVTIHPGPHAATHAQHPEKTEKKKPGPSKDAGL